MIERSIKKERKTDRICDILSKDFKKLRDKDTILDTFFMGGDICTY